MPTAVPPTLTEERLDNLVYLARAGETSELIDDVNFAAKALSATPASVVAAAIDKGSGNSLIHYASANGHLETVTALLSFCIDSPLINTVNSSGNTPLHWAALNGHLETVKALMAAGSDVTITNNTGHDAVYVAEMNNKSELAEWLLKESKSLEAGLSNVRENEELSEEEIIINENNESATFKGSDQS